MKDQQLGFNDNRMGSLIYKICNVCQETKDTSLFVKQRRNKDGHTNTCKSCYCGIARINRIKYKKPPKIRKKIDEETKELRRVKRKQYEHEYYLKNKDTDSFKASRIRHRRSDKRRIYKKEYYAKNEWFRTWTKEYVKKLKRDNPDYKFSSRMRSNMWRILKGKRKGAKLIELLGCTIPVFRVYMESLFQEGMTWDNHETFGWHIDHIKPCVAFDLTDIEQQKECFHYTNLQPLWAKDNLRKGADWKNE